MYPRTSATCTGEDSPDEAKAAPDTRHAIEMGNKSQSRTFIRRLPTCDTPNPSPRWGAGVCSEEEACVGLSLAAGVELLPDLQDLPPQLAVAVDLFAYLV